MVLGAWSLVLGCPLSLVVLRSWISFVLGAGGQGPASAMLIVRELHADRTEWGGDFDEQRNPARVVAHPRRDRQRTAFDAAAQLGHEFPGVPGFPVQENRLAIGNRHVEL